MSTNRDIVTAFKKSSASGAGANTDCVEVAHTAGGGRAVRDGKNRGGGVQFHTSAGWAAFIDGVKGGAFGN